jgi:hypothetical protein
MGSRKKRLTRDHRPMPAAIAKSYERYLTPLCAGEANPHGVSRQSYDFHRV